MFSSPPVICKVKTNVKPTENDVHKSSKPNSSDGGVKYNKFQHLVKKTTMATQDVMLFVKLRKLSI